MPPKKKKSKGQVLYPCFVCFKIIINKDRKARYSYQHSDKESKQHSIYYVHGDCAKNKGPSSMSLYLNQFIEMEERGEAPVKVLITPPLTVHITSEQFEPSSDQKGDDLELIKIALTQKGKLSRREISLLTNIKESTVTWRIWDNMINPERKKTLFFIAGKGPKGIELLSYDPQEPECIPDHRIDSEGRVVLRTLYNDEMEADN